MALFYDCVVISLKLACCKNVNTGYLINTSLQYDMYHSYVTQRKNIRKIRKKSDEEKGEELWQRIDMN